ncbi:MAG: glycerol acyltransferase, partial [Spirochaetales bacterium]|nr:glycerol acyltransferase [Spirochaetales bacterium]
DNQIHLNYRLWDTNYFAYDHLNGTDRFSDMYADLNTKSFEKHYRHLKPEVQNMVFQNYANPVVSMLNETEGADAE